MADRQSLGRRWENYRPSKATWFWSCAACVVATLVIGFTWGGWVTGGTSTRMAVDAADGARAQMAADCVNRFQSGPAAIAELAELKKIESSYSRSDLLQKAGWVTMPGSKDPVAGAAAICAQVLVNPAPPTTKG